MIKINEGNFDLKTINSIYDELAIIINNNLNNYNNSQDKDVNIINKFNKKFGSDSCTRKDNIKDYLMNSDIDEIEQTILEFSTNTNVSNIYILINNLYKLSGNTLVKNIMKNLTDSLGDKYKSEIKTLVKYINRKLINQDDRFNKKNKNRCLRYLRKIDTYRNQIDLIIWNNNMEKIISYDLLSKEQRHQLIGAMNVEVCPYCNRQYITNWIDENLDMHPTADLDHFYPKSLYPIASLCLHNFIPSCHICNSRFKLDKDFYKEKHVYPYKMEFGEDAKFKIDNILSLIGEEPRFSIKNVKGVNKKEIDNSIETFKLNEVYKSHTNYVQELINKFRTYNQSQIKEYLQYKGIFKDEEEIISFVFGDILNIKNVDKYPLSKLTKDILDDVLDKNNKVKSLYNSLKINY